MKTKDKILKPEKKILKLNKETHLDDFTDTLGLVEEPLYQL